MEDSQGKRRTYLEIECPGCKTTFIRLKKSTYRNVRKGIFVEYCTPLCKSVHLGSRVEVECSMCGKTTSKKSSSLRNSKHGVYFCSRKCKDQGQRVINGINEIHPPHYNTGSGYYSKLARTEHGNTCINCGTSFAPLLAVHHIDGDRENFSIDNLEVVCYNHHVLRHMRLREGDWVLDWKVLTPRDVLTHLIEESLTVVEVNEGP
jgi:endogenous inhibitor of DNA gyrase (YacG/DUF329 family)